MYRFIMVFVLCQFLWASELCSVIDSTVGKSIYIVVPEGVTQSRSEMHFNVRPQFRLDPILRRIDSIRGEDFLFSDSLFRSSLLSFRFDFHLFKGSTIFQDGNGKSLLDAKGKEIRSIDKLLLSGHLNFPPDDLDVVKQLRKQTKISEGLQAGAGVLGTVSFFYIVNSFASLIGSNTENDSHELFWKGVAFGTVATGALIASIPIGKRATRKKSAYLYGHNRRAFQDRLGLICPEIDTLSQD